MKHLFTLMIALIVSSVMAQDSDNLTKKKILHVTVNISQSFAEVFMYNNENGDIDHFEWKITHADDEDETDTFTPEDVRQGTVFKEGIPKKFVKIDGQNFSEVYGGDISISYPKNVVLGSRRSESFEVERIVNEWLVHHRSNKDFKRVHVIVNKAFGIPVGADRVEFLD